MSSAGVLSSHRQSAATYLAGENALRKVHDDVMIVRPTMIYGSARDRNVHHVIAFARRFHFLPLLGDGTALLQPIHYRDLAAAIAALVFTTAEGPLFAGGGDAVTIRDAGATIFAALGQPARFLPVPLGPALALAGLADVTFKRRWRERILRALDVVAQRL